MINSIHRSMAGGILAGLASICLAQLPADALAQSASADLAISYSAAGEPVQATVNADRAFIEIDLNQQADFAVVRISGPGLFSISKRVENTNYLAVDLVKDFDISAYVDGEIDKQAVSGLDYLPDGQYTFEIMVHSPEGERHTTRGKFEVFGGNAFLLPSLDQTSNNDREVSDIRQPGLLQRLAGSVLDFIVPSAHAGDFPDDFVTITDTAGDDDTGLTFSNEQTTDADVEFAIRNQDGVLRIFDDGGVPAPGATTLLNIVGSTGKVGFGTQNPEETIHLVTTNPFSGFRLEDTQGSWTLNTGGVGSDLGFRIRDSANGTTPFRIETTAPTNSIRVTADGNIGFGTPTPEFTVDVQSSTGLGQIRITETNGSNGLTMFALENTGHPRFRLRNSTLNSNWDFRTAGSDVSNNEQFQITNISNGESNFLFRLFKNGDLEVEGDVTANGVLLTSSRESKTDFAPLNEAEVLDQLSQLEISKWRYKHEKEGTQHFGPIAEDFHSIFGLSDGKHLNMIDVGGIAFAAIQALNEKKNILERQNQDLQQRLERLEETILQ